jgi:lipid A 3-O-deacylase
LKYNMRYSSWLPVLSGLIWMASAHAAGPADLWEEYRRVRADGTLTLRLHVDNDTLLLNQRDGFYTSGGRIIGEHWLHEEDRSTGFGWRIGQELYTASDIKLPPERIAPLDHPYAAWLYGGFFRETYRQDGYHDKIGIDIGCLGPCAQGEWTQRNLHRILRQPLPQGWSRQMRDEPGIMLYGQITPRRWAVGDALDVAPYLHGRFGNIHADAGLGVTARAGILDLRPGQPALHAYLRLEASAVAYNATLQGGYFSTDDPHTVRPKRAVGEAELGVRWSRGAFGVRAAIVRRSNGIADLPNALGAQNYARFMFSYAP